jgi:hypothetical protein
MEVEAVLNAGRCSRSVKARRFLLYRGHRELGILILDDIHRVQEKSVYALLTGLWI